MHTDPPCDHISRNKKVTKNCRHLCQNAAIRVLLTAPIFFWRNSDLFKKKVYFSSSKIDKIRAVLRNLSKFHEKIAKICNKNLWNGFDSKKGTENHPINTLFYPFQFCYLWPSAACFWLNVHWKAILYLLYGYCAHAKAGLSVALFLSLLSHSSTYFSLLSKDG